MRYLGIDLAWGEGTKAKPANRSGVVALESSGEISAAGWTIGLDDTIRWRGPRHTWRHSVRSCPPCRDEFRETAPV